MTETLLEIDQITKRFGGFVALDGVTLSVPAGVRYGLIGPNGSGKTTLINCISGTLRVDGGRMLFGGRVITTLAAWQRTRLGIARSFQIPKPFASMSVLENLLVPLDYARRQPMADGAREEALRILADVGLDRRADDSAAGLTQIECRKLELARAIAAAPQLLIADEVMAGLSSSEVDEILAILFALNERGVTIVMIEHIMRAVLRFSQRIAVLDAGHKIADGDPDAVMANPDVERAYLGE